MRETGRELEREREPQLLKPTGPPAQGLPGRDPRPPGGSLQAARPLCPTSGYRGLGREGASDRPYEVQPDRAAGARSPTTDARLAAQGRHLHLQILR